MNIREPRLEDEQQIREIFSKYYCDPASGIVEQDNVDYFTTKVTYFIARNERDAQAFYFLVAENQDGKVVGVGGLRDPIHWSLEPFATTEKPVELYSLFVLEKKEGIGSALNEALLMHAKQVGHTEMIVHSADRFEDSWSFYDKVGYERIANIDDGEGRAQIWTMKMA